MSVCLDSYALLAWMNNENGASTVDGYLQQASSEDDFFCYISTINLAEVYYRVWRAIGSSDADSFWQECQNGVLPLTIVDDTRRRVLEAARLRAQYPIALGDAFAVQLAQELSLPLATGDPEIGQIEAQANLHLIWLAT